MKFSSRVILILFFVSIFTNVYAQEMTQQMKIYNQAIQQIKLGNFYNALTLMKEDCSKYNYEPACNMIPLDEFPMDIQKSVSDAKDRVLFYYNQGNVTLAKQLAGDYINFYAKYRVNVTWFMNFINNY